MRKLVCLAIVILASFLFSGCVSSGSKLFTSARQGDLQAIKGFIESGGDPNLRGKYDYTLLHCSAWQPLIAKYLIENGADLNAKAIDGSTPLHRAQDPGVIKALVNAGADVNVKDNTGWTPLRSLVGATIRSEDKDLYIKSMQLLMENGANPDQELMKSVYSMGDYETFSAGNQEASKKLLAIFINAGASLDFLYSISADDNQGVIAGVSGEAELSKSGQEFIKHMVSKGYVNPNRIGPSGNTLLHQAAKLNSMGLARFLIANGANPAKRNDKGQTPDDIFAENARIAQERARQAKLKRQQERRKKKQRNAFLGNALAGAVMGAAIHDAGGTADQAVQSGMATYQDLSNGTTSNMQGLADQYNQQAKEAEASNMASIRQGQAQLDKEYNQWEQQQKAKTASYNNCVNRGGKWIDGQCYMPSGSQSKTYKQNTQSSSYSSAGSQYASSSTNRPGNGSTSSKKKMIDCKPITDACMMRKVGFTADEQKSYMWGKCGKRNEGALYGDTKWNSCRDKIYKKASDAIGSCAGEVTKMLRADNARCIGATAMVD